MLLPQILLVATAALVILAARRGALPGGSRAFGALLLMNAASLALSAAFSTQRALSFYGAAMQGVAMLFAWLASKYRARIVLVGIVAALAASSIAWQPVRPQLWRDALAMASHRPLLGYGPETFAGTFPLYESRALEVRDLDAVYESSRNFFLDALVSQGVPGLLILCALCAVAWRGKWFAAVILLLQFTPLTLPMALLLYTVLAVAASPVEEMRPAPILTAIAPFVVVALLYGAVRFAIAGHALTETRRLMETREFHAATAEYETYWFWHVPGAGADIWYSQLWLDVARRDADPAVRDEAIEIATQAAERATLDPERPALAWFHSAQVAAQRQDFDGIEFALGKTIAASPNWYRPHWMLSQQFLRESREEEGAREAAIAERLRPNNR